MKLYRIWMLLLLLSSSQPMPMPMDLLYFFTPIFNGVDVQKTQECIDTLGCFRKDGLFYDPDKRPISVTPQGRDTIGTAFYLFTRNNPIQRQQIRADYETLLASNFNPIRPTKVIIHGYLIRHFFGEYQLVQIEILTRLLLEIEDCNVIVTDWGAGATHWYFQASANTRVVGAELALLLNFFIREMKASASDFHIIGHSLGSHIAGYAGERVPGLARISAIDPAKPYFEGTHVTVRLDLNDATFIDVIHTNAPVDPKKWGLGTRQPLGHIDFYPNNGEDQPGCIAKKENAMKYSIYSGLREYFTCDHSRSLEMYINSIRNQKCLPLAYSCPSWDAFESGHCYRCGIHGENCALMGHNVQVQKQRKQRFYLKTNERTTLCAFQYRVEVAMASSVPLNMMLVRLYGDQNKEAEGFSRVTYWEARKNYAFIITSTVEIKYVKKAQIDWINSGRTSTRRRWSPSLSLMALVGYIKVTPLNYWSDRFKDKLTVTFCDKEKGYLTAPLAASLKIDSNLIC